MVVKLFATLREHGGACVDADASDVGGLLATLTGRFGAPFREELLDASGALRAGVVVLVNGVNVHALGGLAAPLRAEDTVSIFPLVGGG